MTRLEEIKYLVSYNEMETEDVPYKSYVRDVSYLLELVEKYEKALMTISGEDYGHFVEENEVTSCGAEEIASRVLREALAKEIGE